MNLITRLACGAAAGAAGTTALNAVSYLDMFVQGRAASEVPADTAKDLAGRAHIGFGEGDSADNRAEAVGALLGIATGIGVGAAVGLTPPGWSTGAKALTAGTLATLGGDAGPVLLGETDPRTWGVRGWASSVVPHIAFGLVTAGVLKGLVSR